MFVTAGHPEAEEALKKFADFLEKESKEGKMSPQVQKKVLGRFPVYILKNGNDNRDVFPIGYRCTTNVTFRCDWRTRSATDITTIRSLYEVLYGRSSDSTLAELIYVRQI